MSDRKMSELWNCQGENNRTLGIALWNVRENDRPFVGMLELWKRQIDDFRERQRKWQDSENVRENESF